MSQYEQSIVLAMHYFIDQQTSSPRTNGFVECMVGAAKKSMDKAGKEGK